MTSTFEYLNNVPTEYLYYEEEVLRDPFTLKKWLFYLDALKYAVPKVKFSVYERAVAALPRSYKLWTMYLRERQEYTKKRHPSSKSYLIVNRIYERSLVYLNKMPVLWSMFCRFLLEQCRWTYTRHALDRALRSLPVTQHNRIWPIYLEFARKCGVAESAARVFHRYMKLEPFVVEEFAEYLKEAGRYDEAASIMSKLLCDPQFAPRKKGRTKHDLWLELCELLVNHGSEVYHVDVEGVLRGGLKSYEDEAGTLWCYLADYYTQKGLFEKARDIYEEALEKVKTVRDFSVVFDAYAKFEESILTHSLENASEETSTVVDDEYLDLTIYRLEDLMNRRPLLLSSVILRQNPHNVREWHKRAKLFVENDPVSVLKTYSEAIQSIDPAQATNGRLYTIWVAFARFYEIHGDLDSAREVLEEATDFEFRHTDDLVNIYCEYVELELRHNNLDKALLIGQRAVKEPKQEKNFKANRAKAAIAAGAGNIAIEGNWNVWRERAKDRAWRSPKLWGLLADLEESLGSFERCCAVYERMIDLKICTAQNVLNYAAILEENRFFEDAFRIYERGVALFCQSPEEDEGVDMMPSKNQMNNNMMSKRKQRTFNPAVLALWLLYIDKFLQRYGGEKMERTRDLFEAAIRHIPSTFLKTMFMFYANTEEVYGSARRVMSILERAVEQVPVEDRYSLFQFYIAKSAKLYGLARLRVAYEQAIASVQGAPVIQLCLEYADLETRLGEYDRARAVYSHGAQLADPREYADYWKIWNDFEVAHGTEDSFRDMLRVKKSVETLYSRVHYAAPMAQTAVQPDAMELIEQETIKETQESIRETANIQENPDEIELSQDSDREEEQEGNKKGEKHDIEAIEQQPLPETLFQPLAKTENRDQNNNTVGALERFKRKKRKQDEPSHDSLE
ncbi:Pre-mRNA-splicing factor SYF1 [Galdieria sulphuraria]|uniref:Pre-mRNA-splicing factor SYF1 n=1 Tax=Galdieria sulphuraria TaxID=130081 RepID=M2WUA8_GALSU|nr:pre-mRNA-splicing factor SYF1 [Galdieria sulphuraria]EME27500.1 pre-mRNA-splicing factor SYF1 [Galdieria sulphuraria]GJD06445.1 Pre-mRNA-splicing factor SYF1 [Galdieria sulphuraria]|eukprot:XP_005704020.1 pre-mRNA-splicing factor SYF1 [Galdieria sulphuraria]